ncbi:NAD(P)/FAD-dependent oxidoreductase [Mycolicibacterium wolinskyi]|uniref:FAD-dependent oxidoreductase n=1 Tax=Mycolicibacterium wolinskyi TaxID=59750 RepID=A0A1X2FIY2_9MYCO|nr:MULTISPECIES: NAD(P)/FAD-dependent oxidoreductase [Mycolicibacterium]MCV7288165.1 NAD(P)/FAD-dependent oxidoreductase [Mycolicibacterium wolinskyi]MCV7296890.1 NAD(P)/FAD-dependent oxidoreductase [Mycolicibacterium goodii]ORX18406.1 FAD-dependent oxidoreductase [Mycolicibacterium wolinskyi]
MNTGASHAAIVIGAGQSGLAAAAALQHRGLRPIVVDARPDPGGSWPDYYHSLTLFSPARYSALPGMSFPGDPDRYPRRDDVIDYLRRYAATLQLDIHTNTLVTTVTHDGEGFTVTTATGHHWHAPIVIAATGSFAKPYIPALPGAETFTGRLLHASDYRASDPWAGQRIVIVGGGNSAIQIGAELATLAHVTLATRRQVRLVPQRPLGRDIHVWLTRTGLDTAPVGPWLARPPTVPVFDQGRYRRALGAGRPDRRPMFRRLDGDTVVWRDETREQVDVVLCATGYRPALDYLSGLGALDNHGAPRQRRGLSTTHPGLGFVGVEWQRSLSSASLRGVGRDAIYVVDKLLAHNTSKRPVHR